ncbi:MAG TPA: undecaprenyl-diphosphate phosphatase [Thermoanaerobaculia bacterium]|nr:undecaprenyl-diphosphate phosphatase [Thermoanaerobaculia bacterium]HUM29495.1 undecaprenyl-diphosphate phosphatase [Thermoanaerobaculia bacterium]HXK67878.1 undecaprenyl-diphosphate phosphatase [Thermoanaerobaculia bacterium]
MTLPSALLLSLVQALTEFFPVSSSGHLAFVQMLLPDFQQTGLLFDLWLHLATMVAILLYYRKDLARYLTPRGLIPLVITTAVTGGLGLLLHDVAEVAFHTMPWVAGNLMVTGLVLALASRLPQRELPAKMTPVRAALIGLAQGCAVFPGLSRSGLTVVACLAAGLDREEAARYTFIAAIPVILAASGYEILKTGVALSSVDPVLYLSSFLVTFLTGFLALALFVPMVKRLNLQGFSLYCIIVAGGMLIVHGIR